MSFLNTNKEDHEILLMKIAFSKELERASGCIREADKEFCNCSLFVFFLI